MPASGRAVPAAGGAMRTHAPERKGLSGQALVDWVSAMAAKYPDNVRVS